MVNRMDRRQLLAAALSGMALPASVSRAGQFSGKIRKAVKYHMIAEELSVGDKFRLLSDLGFDGVEPRTADARTHLQEMIRGVEQTGVRVHGVVNSSSPEIAAAVEVARQVGADSVLLVVPTHAQGSYLDNYRQRQELIRRALPTAERHGIRLLIENVWASFLIEPLSMARFVDELDSPMVGVYFDVGNNIRWGYAAHWIEVLGQRIGKLDIKEYSRQLQNEQGLRAGFNVEIGEGSVDWERVRGELAKLEFEGWATAEVRGGDRRRLADIAARMDRVLDL